MEDIMPSVVEWTSDQLANTTTAGAQINARVAALDDGGYVVHWNGYPDGSASFCGFFQMYDAFGNPVGGEQQFVLSGGGIEASIAPLSGGGFLALWDGFDGLSSWGVLGQVFDATGAPIGAAAAISDEIDPDLPADQFLPMIVALEGGGFVVSYLSTDVSTDQTALIRMLDSTGNPVGPSIPIATAPNGQIGNLSVTSIGGGQFVVAWQSGNLDLDCWLQIFDEDGTAVTGVLPAATGTGLQQAPEIASDGTGQFLLTYYDAPTSVCMGQIFSSTGVPTGAAFPISDDAQNGQGGYYAKPIAVPGGGYFVAWIEYDGSKDTIAGQLLDAQGNKVGDEIIVRQAATASHDMGDMRIALLADGRVVVSWSEQLGPGADADDFGVFSKIIDPRGGQIFGTNHSETILGSKDGTQVADTITAKNGNDTIVAYDGNDTIMAGAGNDLVVGGDGADSMDGGEGDDQFIVDDAGDVIVEAVGGGNDKVLAYVTYVLDTRAEIETLIVAADTNADLTGNDFGQLLQGNDWQNKLYGMGGDDTFKGGGDIDTLSGGLGDDLYYVDDEDEVLIELAGEGTDTVRSTVSYTLEALTEVENMTLVGAGDLDGTGNGKNNHLIGTAGANLLTGLGGNDTLDGGSDGEDSLIGGEGDDRYIVQSEKVTVTELANQGSDTIVSSFDYVLGATLEHLELAVGSGAIKGTGNAQNNKITGNENANSLTGGAGNDTIDGGANLDYMFGGLGDDVYLVDELNDHVIEFDEVGVDTIRIGNNYSLSKSIDLAFVENLTLLGTGNFTGTGNALGNLLKGNIGSNVLNGLDGNDILTGGNGNDTTAGGKGDDSYVVEQAGDVVKENANEGIDIVYAYVSHTLAANVENLELFVGVTGTGNGLANKLTGNGANNALNGLDGNDTLDGGAGNDTMNGGKGNDFFIVSQAGDQVKENANEGIDTVTASVDHTLAANVENLVLKLGSAATKGTGNLLNNSLTGNDLANTLSGGAGNDTLDGGNGVDSLDGGSGDDTYVLGSSADKVKDSAGADDLIVSSVTRSLASFVGIENLTLTGAAKINGNGNSVANDLIGNSAANQLKGGGGGDLLRGKGGADVLTGGAGKDFFDFDSIAEIGKTAGKRDIIKDFLPGIDRIDLKSIDASSGVAGNQPFKFVAAEGSAFSGVAGELIWDQRDKPGTSKDITLVSGDINGDKIADFQLELTGLIALTKIDFIL
jgi:Ca2+-binding RTX toxin-like protein